MRCENYKHIHHNPSFSGPINECTFSLKLHAVSIVLYTGMIRSFLLNILNKTYFQSHNPSHTIMNLFYLRLNLCYRMRMFVILKFCAKYFLLKYSIW